MSDAFDRLRELGGNDAIRALVHVADGCLPEYLARFGSTIPDLGVARARYVERVADSLAYHWLDTTDDMTPGLPPLDWVLRGIRVGRPANRPVNCDVLAEVCLAEGVCQGDNGAREYFYKHYARVIADAARRIGGHRAEEALEGLPQDLVCDPRRLASFGGHSSLSAWLQCVVRRIWLDVHRRKEREEPWPEASSPSCTNPQPASVSLPEFVEVGTDPLEAWVRWVVGVLTAKEASWVRMHYLDKVPQVEIAVRWGVNKSTVCRHLQEAKRKVLEGVQEHNEGTSLAEALGVSTAQLAHALAEALRQLTDET